MKPALPSVRLSEGFCPISLHGALGDVAHCPDCSDDTYAVLWSTYDLDGEHMLRMEVLPPPLPDSTYPSVWGWHTPLWLMDYLLNADGVLAAQAEAGCRALGGRR